MLRSLRELIGCMLVAEDGEIGRCKDFLFDDRDWVIRYVVADTRKWLSGRKVLVPPVFLGTSDPKGQTLAFRVSRSLLQKSPPLDERMTVSRRYEKTLFDHYGWPYYWEDGAALKANPTVSSLLVADRRKLIKEEVGSETGPLLCSLKEVKGYEVHGIDGRLGNAVDFIMDDNAWVLRWLLIDTSYLLPGKMVVLDMCAVRSIDCTTMDIWMEACVNELENTRQGSSTVMSFQ